MKHRQPNALLLIGVAAFVIGAGLVVGVLRSGSTHHDAVSTGDVLVATKALPAGTSGSNALSAVTLRKVPSNVRATDALTSSTQLQGRVLDVDIAVGEQLRASQLRPQTVRGSSIVIPKGMQGVSVQLPFVAGGGGYVGAGDLVDIYGNVAVDKGSAQTTKLVLSNIKVLDVSTEVAPRVESGQTDRPAGQNVTYLLALSPDQAERVIFLASNGQLWITLAGDNPPVGPTSGHTAADVLK